MSEWQPIETAPEGEYILVIVAKNNSGGGPFVPDVAKISAGFLYSPSQEGFVAKLGDTWPITHWMPLPEPPK